MSVTVYFEVVNIHQEDGVAVLNNEDGDDITMFLEHLPANLKEGKFLKFVVSHTDYNPDKEEYKLLGKENDGSRKVIPKGNQLSY